MKTKFKEYSNEVMKSTVIISEVVQFEYFHFHHLFKGKLKALYEGYAKLVDDINEEYKDVFYVPGETVAFSTQFAIKGKNFELAKEIADKLYSFIKDRAPELTFKIGIGYGDVTVFGKTSIHHSNGPVWWKVGRSVDSRKTDGIEIIEGEWNAENMKDQKLKKRLLSVVDEKTMEDTISIIDKFNNNENKDTYLNLMKFVDDTIKKIKKDNDKDYYMSLIWRETGLDHKNEFEKYD